MACTLRFWEVTRSNAGRVAWAPSRSTVHRLDMFTSGVVCFAKHSDSAKRLHVQFRPAPTGKTPWSHQALLPSRSRDRAGWGLMQCLPQGMQERRTEVVPSRVLISRLLGIAPLKLRVTALRLPAQQY